MTDHKPMPVQGYTIQSQPNIDLSNEGKVLEERVLRYIERVVAHAKANPVPDGHLDERARYAAVGRTNIQDGFMWTIRAIFNPQRAKLPEDSQT
jgi:hypothetical protein